MKHSEKGTQLEMLLPPSTNMIDESGNEPIINLDLLNKLKTKTKSSSLEAKLKISLRQNKVKTTLMAP